MCCLSFLSTASPCKSVFNVASSSLATWTGPADLGDGILVRDSSSESKTVDVICSGRKDLFMCRAFHDCVPFVGKDRSSHFLAGDQRQQIYNTSTGQGSSVSIQSMLSPPKP